VKLINAATTKGKTKAQTFDSNRVTRSFMYSISLRMLQTAKQSHKYFSVASRNTKCKPLFALGFADVDRIAGFSPPRWQHRLELSRIPDASSNSADGRRADWPGKRINVVARIRPC
jgi:hypothetical protein